MRFDLARAVAETPPPSSGPRSPLDGEPLRGWLARLVEMRDAGRPGITATYMARILTRGAREEGIIEPTATISEYAMRRRLRQ